ncbi:MAG: response regulator [Lachnospiraceae bacterium]|nr:response regulator [Candidatus Colinaster equi]
MYRIMLADDEGIVINSLTYIIEKNFDGQFEIDTAKSGRAAIEVAENFRPDIVFMDIQMPGINGIEAMHEIRTMLPTTIFIVLTAYDKFDYAKESINLGVLEYLNKPIVQTKVVKVINQAIEELDRRREKRRQDLQVKERLETVVPIIENGFIYSLLLQENSEEDIENYKNLLGIDTIYGYMMAIVFGEMQQGAHMTNVVGSSVKAQTVFYAKVREILKEAIPNAIIGNVTSNKIPVFIPQNDLKMEYAERSNIIEKARVIVREMRDATDVNYRIGIGGIKRLKNSIESYDEALKALYSSTGSVAHVDDLPIAVSYEEDYPIDLENSIFEHLEEADVDACIVMSSKFFDWMSEHHRDDIMSVKLKSLEFVLRAESQMYKSGGHTYSFDSRKDYLKCVCECEDLEQLRQWFLDKMKSAVGNMTTGTEDHTHHLIKKAVEYIENNFYKDISLEEISQMLNLSSYYFSKLFKEEKGEGFVEYLTKRRVDEAKELLKDPEKSIKEIGSSCGYFDPNYFSRIFKKATGMTPTEYKEKIGSGY